MFAIEYRLLVKEEPRDSEEDIDLSAEEIREYAKLRLRELGLRFAQIYIKDEETKKYSKFVTAMNL